MLQLFSVLNEVATDLPVNNTQFKSLFEVPTEQLNQIFAAKVNKSAANFTGESIKEDVSLEAFGFNSSCNAFTNHKYDDFLKAFPGYGYNGTIYKLREEQFPEISESTYLDYTGAGMYQRKQVEAAVKRLLDPSVLQCNAHSDFCKCAEKSTEVIEQAREEILKFFGTDISGYTLIFTSGATQALKIVGESFPWSNDSLFLYTTHAHNSLLGIREYAKLHGAKFQPLPFTFNKRQIPLQKHRPNVRELFDEQQNIQMNPDTKYHLVGIAAEDNFSGVKYALELIHAFQSNDLGKEFRPEGSWQVMLDASAFVPTNPLNLTEYPASFVSLSFYKMFGFPTGLGCLLVRNDIAGMLHKTYFSGGSVVLSSSDEDMVRMRPRYNEKFEDGTLNFQGISQAIDGIKVLEEMNMTAIQQHVWSLTRYFYIKMSELRHPNGRKMIQFFGEHEQNNPDVQGSVMSFIILDRYGTAIGYFTVMKKMDENNVMIRSGASCNPGISTEILEQAAKLKNTCGDELDMLQGWPLGAVRVSIGYPTTVEEVDRTVEIIKKEFYGYKNDASVFFK